MAATVSDQVALVTGGGRGIGKAIALALAASGASVGVTARSEGEVQETVREIMAAGGNAIAVCADARNADQVLNSVAAVSGALGTITLLVNNASAPGPAGNDWEVDAEAWWDCIEGCVRGAFLYNQAVIPAMMGHGGGRIIHIASLTGTRAFPPVTATSVAKTALIRLSEGLAASAGSRGIVSFAVHPGIVRTELLLSYNLGIPVSMFVPPERAGTLCVRLGSGAYDRLSGRFLTIDDDLDDLAARADEIGTGELHTLRIRS